ncbi:enolase-phosphatase E1-like [Salvia hispanica]|uniref:enolase-phosphatase E1-like n=1 Tax=Salvia hispanica TaxID=49212 RepID=UPI002009ABBB|nr:enolase-phosphatase E1-like [Salvia hispanica]XP_047960574.1 enolase-phosphatase E1-like [Salvia hispanica]
MEKIKPDTPLDYAVFQLSPKHSRCELFVSSGGSTEKLASGLLKPFVTHLKVAEAQAASASQSIKLDPGRHKNAKAWFTKGTLDRFVRFVSTPEVLELVNTFDAEMSQLEAARRIYSQGMGNQLSGGGGFGSSAADDATKKELLKAIDLRLVAAQQDLTNACARAAAAGFDADTIPELQMFADIFGAERLNEACGKYISLYERRPHLINQLKSGSEDRAIRSSCTSDMSIDNDLPSPPRPEPATHQKPRHTFSRESSVERDGGNKPGNATGENDKKDETSAPDQTGSIQASQPGRRLSVQDRINMFENKQKENSGGKPPVVKPVELRRLSSDVSMMGAAAEKGVLRRWSGVGDMSIDLSAEKKDSESPLCTPSMKLPSQEDKVLDSDNDTTKGSSIIKPQSSVIPSESRSEISGLKDRDSLPTQIRETRDKSAAQSSLTSTWKTMEESWASEGVSDSRLQEAFDAQHKEIEDDSSSAQQELRSCGETEVVENTESIEDSGPQRMKFYRKVSGADLSKKTTVLPDGSSRILFSGKIAKEAQEGFDSFATPPEQLQRGRQTKANQDRNDELQMKANELEKLFAEHKLRVPADLSNSSRKGKLDDTQHLPVSSLQYSKPIPDISPQVSDSYNPNEPTGNLKNKTKLNASSSMKTVDSQNKGDALKKSFSELSVSEGSRGKQYQRYVQKRDEKLKEDWSSNRTQKEARLKSMQDSLERNKSEMKAKLSGSADRQSSVSSARRRAERLRSYNSRSMLNNEQEHLDFGDCDFDDDALDFREKKLMPNNKKISSTTPRPSATPVSRPASKASTGSVKRRMQPENPLAQSVPNFSDLRKENTKPYSGGGKAMRSQVRNHTRSKSITEEMGIVKEDKSRRSQALRKGSANPSEFKDVSSLDSDGVVLTQIKFDEDIQKNVGTKPFLRKGSRAARTSIARQRVSAGSERVNDMDENDGIASEPDECINTVQDEGEEELKSLNTEEDNILEAREPELDTFVNSESENGDDTLTFSAVDQALGSKFPREIPSCFLPADSVQDWHNGSQMSWNSRTQHPFSYPHETFDADTSVDSPIGSPSWNSHSLNVMEADAARMRKKWGAAEKPMVAANSSRKDMTRGFKRLLKFGRKNRGSETMADWVSATTSEGDDDTEDGRDLANRSSEDLRKSRMGFSLAQPSDDGFNENELFNDSEQSSQSSIPAPPANFRLREDHVSGTSIKAPRSFFSLSTFRSKGNESKPR